MTAPKMMIFDYGHTLGGELGFDGLKGTQAIMRHVVANPRGLSAQQVCAFANKIFYEICGGPKVWGADIELHNRNYQQLVYEYLQLEFDVPLADIEEIFWDAAAPGVAMPNAGEMLDYLAGRGIRTGVISNISFSGASLAARMGRLLPNNTFEFVIASSEYMIRKPNPMIFELALRKANLAAGDVWYCGDSPRADIAGANAVGIYPVWYENKTLENPFREKNYTQPTCEHLHIHDWREMVAVLEGLV